MSPYTAFYSHRMFRRHEWAKSHDSVAVRRGLEGSPIVATVVSGNAELVRSGTTGKTVPCDYPQALADVVLRLANEAARRVRMSRPRRRDVERRFSPGAGVVGRAAVRRAARTHPPPPRSLKAMCGITGAFDTTGQHVFDRRVLDRMNQSLSHRDRDENSEGARRDSWSLVPQELADAYRSVLEHA